nr:hypothetical protein [uncultured Rhodopila sp.]
MRSWLAALFYLFGDFGSWASIVSMAVATRCDAWAFRLDNPPAKGLRP